jgi:hypothetical protein
MKTEKSMDRLAGKRLSQLLGLLVAFALIPLVLHAEDWDHLNGRDKVHDPTGAWLVRFHTPGDPVQHREFLLIVFHKGGTLTENIQGESGFDPNAVPLPSTDPNYSNNVISSPSAACGKRRVGTLLRAHF